MNLVVLGADTNAYRDIKASNVFSFSNMIEFRLSPNRRVVTTSQWRIAALENIVNTGRRPTNPRHEWQLRRPTAMARLEALRIIEEIQVDPLPIPFVVPTPDSGIQIEWTKGQRELEIRVEPDGTMIYMQIEDGELARQGNLASALDPILTTLFKRLIS